MVSCIQILYFSITTHQYVVTIIFKFNMKQQISEGKLYSWGKNYKCVQELTDQVRDVAAGENHIAFINNNGEAFGSGSNKFGQLGLTDPITYQQFKPIFPKLSLKSLHCGAEHTFAITQKNQVFSMGLNIKGQLGIGTFENSLKPKIVVSLLPYGVKNPKSLNPSLAKNPKPLIVQILERFQLQVKVDEDPIQSILLLDNDEFVITISCGALFTLALTNKGRLFGCGYQGINNQSSHQQYLQKSKFKLIQLDAKISQISCGLSGAAIISRQGFVYIWGRYGKNSINAPKKIKKNNELMIKYEQDRFAEVCVGDQFILLLSIKGEVYSFGQNFDNQLGTQSEEISHLSKLQKVTAIPLIKKIHVGRNHCLAIAANNELYGWGSNRFGQINPSQDCPMTMRPQNLQISLPEAGKLVLSSYFTLLISAQKFAPKLSSSPSKSVEKVEQTVKASDYKKLFHDYQVIKSLNLALIQKNQPPRKQNKQVQTLSKFEIDGVTKYRQFSSNVEIEWRQLEIIEKINEGGYGIIYKAKWRQINVVVKKFKIQNGDVSLRDFLSECNAMQAIRHPNIVMFLGAVTKPKNYSIILQYCSKGSLWSYLQNLDNQISWQEKKRLAIEIAQGVHYLHSCNPSILHRDLKSLNIFLDQHYRIKIGDFGWTKTLDEYMTNKIGTYQWMAPEVIGNLPYTQKADVFSYSIILWQIASREPPYRNITGSKVSQAVLNNELRPQIPKKTPQPFSRLMKKCWQTDPNRRPTFKQIIRQLEIMKL